LNASCSSHATSDDRKSDRRSKEVMNNYDVCTASRLGRYEERIVGDTEPATDAHNANTDDRAITMDQIRELINELEILTSNQKQKLTAVLMKYQGNFTKKPVKCTGFEYTFQVQGQMPRSTYSWPLPLHCDQQSMRRYGK
jgi:acetyl-CoA carboxylase alpha subunit